jgi:hypothetical protein
MRVSDPEKFMKLHEEFATQVGHAVAGAATEYVQGAVQEAQTAVFRDILNLVDDRQRLLYDSVSRDTKRFTFEQKGQEREILNFKAAVYTLLQEYKETWQ